MIGTGTLMLDPSLEEYFAACDAEEQRRAQQVQRQHQETLAAMEALAAEQSRRVRQLRAATLSIAAALLLAIGGAIYAFQACERANGSSGADCAASGAPAATP